MINSKLVEVHVAQLCSAINIGIYMFSANVNYISNRL